MKLEVARSGRRGRGPGIQKCGSGNPCHQDPVHQIDELENGENLTN